VEAEEDEMRDSTAPRPLGTTSLWRRSCRNRSCPEVRLQPIHTDDLGLASDLQLEEFLPPVQDPVWSLVQRR
jgi:hypothetical protein